MLSPFLLKYVKSHVYSNLANDASAALWIHRAGYISLIIYNIGQNSLTLYRWYELKPLRDVIKIDLPISR